MKRHAVPQNIMDVEFKLFGSLSMRQFGFLAGNIIIALFIYSLPLFDILKWPLVILFVFLGLAMALLTVNGVPFTVWFSNFILALLTTQRRVWKKSAKTPDILKGSYKAEGKYTTHKIDSATKTQVSEMPLLREEVVTKTTELDKSEQEELLAIDKHLKLNYEGKVTNKMSQESKTIPKVKPTPAKTQKPQPKFEEVVIQKEKQNMADATENNNPNFRPIESNNTIRVARYTTKPEPNRPLKISNVKPLEIARDTEEVAQESEDIQQTSQEVIKAPIEPQETVKVDNLVVKKIEEDNNEVRSLKEQIAMLEGKLKETQNIDNSTTVELQSQISKQIDKVHEEMSNLKTRQEKLEKQDAFSLSIKPSQRPNVISGVVFSKDELPISEVQVEIKDFEGFPKRKTITDKAGQFILSTPLPNGEYFIGLTKAGKKFEDYKINLNGTVLPVFKFTEE